MHGHRRTTPGLADPPESIPIPLPLPAPSPLSRGRGATPVPPVPRDTQPDSGAGNPPEWGDDQRPLSRVERPDGAHLVAVSGADGGLKIEDRRGEEHYRREHIKTLPGVLRGIATGACGPLAQSADETTRGRTMESWRDNTLNGVALACELSGEHARTAAKVMAANIAAASYQLLGRQASRVNRAICAHADTIDNARVRHLEVDTYATLQRSVFDAMRAVALTDRVSHDWSRELRVQLTARERVPAEPEEGVDDE